MAELSKEGQNLLLMSSFSAELMNLLTKYGLKKIDIVGKKMVFRGGTEGYETGMWMGPVDLDKMGDIPLGFKLPKARKKTNE